ERIVEVSLTETGANLRKTAEAIPGQMMAKLDMGEADLRELHSTMTRLIEAVDASHAQQQESSAQA
ncbi:MAG: MarR family transcriptional regulator, partial [Brevibacterium sp.]|nr:MarR family transcriptional regulator [Brevibacterium sp.]